MLRRVSIVRMRCSSSIISGSSNSSIISGSSSSSTTSSSITINKMMLRPHMTNVYTTASRSSSSSSTSSSINVSTTPTTTTTPSDHGNGNSDKKSKSDNDESWLSKHSSKVGFIALTISITLIYRYFKSITMKTDQEKVIADDEAIEPYEYNDLHRNNRISLALYNDIIKAILYKYSNRMISYNDFITFVTNHINDHANGNSNSNGNGINRLQSGHLLDRILLKYMKNNNNNNDNDDNDDKSDKSDNMFEVPLDVDFLLVMLSMTVQGSAEDKIKSLYTIINTNTSNDINASSSNDSNDSNSSSSNDSSSNDSEISKEKLEVLLKHLVDSCQIPSEKQVIETGVSYPLVTYRKKTPKEMIKSYCDVHKYDKATFNLQEIENLLLSGSICLLGECYRSR